MKYQNDTNHIWVDCNGSNLIRHVVDVQNTGGMTRVFLSVHSVDQIF